MLVRAQHQYATAPARVEVDIAVAHFPCLAHEWDNRRRLERLNDRRIDRPHEAEVGDDVRPRKHVRIAGLVYLDVSTDASELACSVNRITNALRRAPCGIAREGIDPLRPGKCCKHGGQRVAAAPGLSEDGEVVKTQLEVFDHVAHQAQGTPRARQSRAHQPLLVRGHSTSRSASVTTAISSAVSLECIGSARARAAIDSLTGKSPDLKPYLFL